MIARLKLTSVAPSFGYIVLVPFLLLLAYYGFYASDRFASESYFIIKENNASSANVNLGFLSVANPSSLEDEKLMEEYLLSGDVLRALDRKIGLKDHFQSVDADWFSRLSEDATQEEFLEYYRKHVDVYFDETSGLLYAETQAFNPAFAQMLLQGMLEQAESFVNSISHQLALAQQAFVEQQLVAAQDKLKEAKQRLLSFQNTHRIFSPEQEGQSLAATINTLEGELIREKASLKQLLSYQNTDAPAAIASRERIRALKAQIDDEKAKMVGEGGGAKLNDLLAQYTNLQLELEFAKDAYASTLVSLEQSRADSSKKMKHLVVVSSPSLPEEAKYPDRLYILATVLIVLLMLYGIVRMMIATVREHQD